MWHISKQPLIILAPMDGYTDSAFRQMVKTIEPRTIVFTEFISARDLSRSGSLADKLLSHDAIEHPLVVQLYGKSPSDFTESAKIAEQHGACGVDINMGCPAKKVVAHSHGSALMKDIGLACEIIRQIKQSVSVPVTVKTRLGWEHHNDLIPFIAQLEEVGLDAVTVHGRTYSQKFQGEANWDPIYALKKELRIPVIGNGDITNGVKAKSKLKNLDGVMVGRAATSNPWLLKEIASTILDSDEKTFERALLSEQAPHWMTYVEKTALVMAERSACQRFRRILISLIKDNGISPQLRQLAIKVESLKDIQSVFDLFIADIEDKPRVI